ERLSVHQGYDARIHLGDRETEASHWVPIGVCADGPEVEARIAGAGGTDSLEGDATVAEVAERAAGDDRVAVAHLGVGAVHRGRDIGHPEVLVAEARRPGGGQLQLTAIEVDRIRDEAERDRVAAAEQARTGEVAAAGIGHRADS